MASQSAGIQQLLQAEKRAAEKIDEAKRKKQKRLKQAKEEATSEIELFKSQEERKYMEHERQILGTRSDLEARIAEETELKIQQMRVQATSQQDKAANMLLELVSNIRPDLHVNFHPEPKK